MYGHVSPPVCTRFANSGLADKTDNLFVIYFGCSPSLCTITLSALTGR